MHETLKKLNILREHHGFPSWTLEQARICYKEKVYDTDPEYLPDDYSLEQYLSEQLYAAGMWGGPEYDD